MGVSLVASSQVSTMMKSAGLANDGQLGFCSSRGSCSNRCMSLVSSDSGINCSDSMAGCSLRASRITPISAVQKTAESGSSRNLKPVDVGRLCVGLPLDVISECNRVNHTKAITVGLKALKLMGIDGVELPVWWGLVEKSSSNYNWSAYLDLVELIHGMGLKVHATFHFNASDEVKIPLPEFVSRIGESNPDVFFTDRYGQRYKDCLSLSVDDLPVLDGRSPVQAYEDFCGSFKLAFASYLDSTITGITMGLGPNGDLRYPSQQGAANGNGVGEFQCYDKYTLLDLKEHAESAGNALWGLGGPHDAPQYDSPPTVGNFFKDQGGSWESSYGDFFLSWYSNRLLSHGDRLLSMASSVFAGSAVAVSGKLPLSHNLCSARSHPCELTSGFYNTVNRDGYEPVAQMFGRNSAGLVLPGMDLGDEQSSSSQIKSACRVNGVGVIGQNSVESGCPEGTQQIKKNLSENDGVVKQFMYQRMGAEFFSPKHFRAFTEMVRGLSQPEMHSDDLPAVEPRLSRHAQVA